MEEELNDLKTKAKNVEFIQALEALGIRGNVAKRLEDTEHLTAAQHIQAQMILNIDCVIRLFQGNVEEYCHVVMYPASARGDMNAYKYVNCGRIPERVFTIIYYVDRPHDTKNLVQNANMKSFCEHLISSPFMSERDYIFLPWAIVESLRTDFKQVKGVRPADFLINYDKFDEWVYEPVVLELAQEAFGLCDSASLDKYRVVCKLEFLVILNINGRISSSRPYNAREQRHSSDMLILQRFVDEVLSCEDFCVMLTGDEPQGITFEHPRLINATKLWEAGLDRFEQRALMYKMTCQYKATIYIGMQSGVNEDAVLLHNTNVFSICENVGSGQVGLARVTEKMKKHSRKRDFHNFFVIKNSVLLTRTGQLAALQIQRSQLADHVVDYHQFELEMSALTEQLLTLGLLDSDRQSIPAFAEALVDASFGYQSDDGEDYGDEEGIFLRRDGYVVTDSSALEKSTRFKKISIGGVSQNGTQYTRVGEERYFRGDEPKPTKNPGSGAWVHRLLEVNAESQLTQRLNIASIVISNLMTITRSICHIRVSPEQGHSLYEVLFDNVSLLNKTKLLDEDRDNYRVVRKQHRRRQSKQYRKGFMLDKLGLMTESQQVEYEAQVGEGTSIDITDQNGSTSDDEILGSWPFD